MAPDGPQPESYPSLQVAFAHDSRRFDGVFIQTTQAIRSLEGSSIRVQVYTCVDPSLEDEYPKLGVILRGYKVPFGGDLERGVNRLLPVFARQLKDVKADLVHLSSLYLAGLVRYRSDVLIGIPDVAKLTTRFYGRIPSYLHNRMLRYVPQARGVICMTEWTRREIVRTLHVPEERVFVLPPWTTPVSLDRSTDGRFAPPTLEKPWTLLGVAVDRPHKNLAFFLEVLARTDGRFRGLLVTRPTPQTLAVVRKLGLETRVSFQAGAPDLSAVYKKAHLFLHPSIYEGFGLPLLEAMAQGLPILASDRTCIPEVVGEGGRLLSPEDPALWSAAIETLTDRERYFDASRRATSRARSFTIEGTRRALLHAYASSV
jgi:glycosyltransferase involved in cell wall biosynthesis